MARDRPATPPTPPLRHGVLRRFGFMTWETLKAYFADNVPQLGAALAFYTTTAVAPLLVLAIAVAQFFFTDGNARRRIIGEIEQLIGSDVSRAVASVQPPSNQHGGPGLATMIGLATLMIGAVAVFTHLQDALNAIWRAPVHTGESWSAMIKRRLFSLATVVATGFIMLVSLTVSAALTWIGENAASRWSALPTSAWQIINFVLSLTVITYLFAIIFKLLPDVQVRWRDVWTGAIVTAILFVGGKTLLALYLANSSVTSAYGAAGSLIALLLWCYYAAQIVFLGAEFTRIHARTHGGRTALEPDLRPPKQEHEPAS
jgi:membrane protein